MRTSELLAPTARVTAETDAPKLQLEGAAVAGQAGAASQPEIILEVSEQAAPGQVDARAAGAAKEPYYEKKSPIKEPC